MEVARINGLDLVIPEKEDVPRWDYGKTKEGRSELPYVWLEAWDCDFRNCVFERHSHKLSKSQRNIVFLDDTRVKDEKERDEGLKILGIFGK